LTLAQIGDAMSTCWGYVSSHFLWHP